MQSIDADSCPEVLADVQKEKPEMDQSETRTILNAKIQQLPQKYKSVLALFYMDELSYNEISEILNLSG